MADGCVSMCLWFLADQLGVDSAGGHVRQGEVVSGNRQSLVGKWKLKMFPIVEGGSGVVQYIENFFLDRMWTQGCKENALNVNNFI